MFASASNLERMAASSLMASTAETTSFSAAVNLSCSKLGLGSREGSVKLRGLIRRQDTSTGTGDRRITVGEHDNHWLNFFVGQKIIKNDMRFAPCPVFHSEISLLPMPWIKTTRDTSVP